MLTKILFKVLPSLTIFWVSPTKEAKALIISPKGPFSNKLPKVSFNFSIAAWNFSCIEALLKSARSCTVSSSLIRFCPSAVFIKSLYLSCKDCPSSAPKALACFCASSFLDNSSTLNPIASASAFLWITFCLVKES